MGVEEETVDFRCEEERAEDFRRDFCDLMEEMDFPTLRNKVLFTIYRIPNNCSVIRCLDGFACAFYSVEIVRTDRDEYNRATLRFEANHPEHYGIYSTMENVARGQDEPYEFEQLPFGFVTWLGGYSSEFNLMAKTAMH